MSLPVDKLNKKAETSATDPVSVESEREELMEERGPDMANTAMIMMMRAYKLKTRATTTRKSRAMGPEMGRLKKSPSMSPETGNEA